MGTGIENVDLGTTDPTVIAVKVCGKITGDDMANLIDSIERIRERGDKARLYLDLTGYEGYDFPVVKEKLMHLRTLWTGIERCAYIVNASWMTTAIGLVDAVTPMHVRAYCAGEDAEARAWLMSPGPGP